MTTLCRLLRFLDSCTARQYIDLPVRLSKAHIGWVRPFGLILCIKLPLALFQELRYTLSEFLALFPPSICQWRVVWGWCSI